MERSFFSGFLGIWLKLSHNRLKFTISRLKLSYLPDHFDVTVSVHNYNRGPMQKSVIFNLINNDTFSLFDSIVLVNSYFVSALSRSSIVFSEAINPLLVQLLGSFKIYTLSFSAAGVLCQTSLFFNVSIPCSPSDASRKT